MRRRAHGRQGPRQVGRREGQLRARLGRDGQGHRARRGLLGPPDRRRAEGPRPGGQRPAGVGARRQGGLGGRAAARQGHPHARLAAAPAGEVQGVRRLVDLRHEPRGRDAEGLDRVRRAGSTTPTRGCRSTTCCRSSSCTRSCARSSRAASAWRGARRRSPRAATGRSRACTPPGMVICGDAGGMVNVPKLKGIHYAIESGRLAAETIYKQLKAGSTDFSDYEKAVHDVRHRQGPLRVAQHEAAVRQGADRRRRDRQRDDDDQGPLPGGPLADASRRRVGAADDRPQQALSQAGRQVHVRQALGRLPDRQRDARRRAEPHPDREAGAARGRRGVAVDVPGRRSTRCPRTLRRAARST